MNSRRAVTLIETLVVTCIIGMIFWAVHYLWLGSMISTRQGIEVLSVTHELARLTSQINYDADRCLKVFCSERPIFVKSTEVDLNSVLKNAPKKVSVMFEVNEGQITYRKEHTKDGQSCVERRSSSGGKSSSIRYYGVGMLQEFSLFPIEIVQRNSDITIARRLALKLVLRGRAGKGSKKNFESSTIISPRGIAKSTWNTFR